MGTASKKAAGEHVMEAPSRGAGARPVAAMRLFLVALAMVFAGSTQTVDARTVKKYANGAIALARDTGQFGYASDSPTSRAAKLEALKQCNDPRCEVVVSFTNGCAALARGPVKYFPAKGATRQEAETKARRLCAAKDCEVVAWACTK